MRGFLWLLIATLSPSAALADDAGIEGKWARACWRGDLDLNIHETTEFDAGTFTVSRFFSAQETCARTDFIFVAKGAYVVSGDTPAVAGALPIDITWRSVELTLINTEAVQAFNEMKTCGISDWALNVPRSISGLVCEGLNPPTIGHTLYALFKVDGNRYYPGDLAQPGFDGTSRAKRPTRLSATYSERQ